MTGTRSTCWGSNARGVRAEGAGGISDPFSFFWIAQRSTIWYYDMNTATNPSETDAIEFTVQT